MITFNKEYFANNYYFYLKESNEKITLYYSVAETLMESRKKDKKMDFDKKDDKKIKKIVYSFLKSKNKPSLKKVEDTLKSVKNKSEIDELVDSDGTMLSSRVPFINQALSPRKTMDQTVAMSRTTNDPVTRGYRVYWGESEDKQDDVLSEVDFSDAFGYEETEDLDFKNSVKTLKKMGVDNAVERTKQFGKIKGVKPKKDKRGRLVLKQRLAEKDSIEEQQKQKMVKMVEDMLAKKSKDDSDVVSKNEPINKILVKNLQSIKKLAEKEGIGINKLINILKKGE
jgi:hypothetical protein